MKISQKQAGLLAREIISQLKSKKAQKISDEMKDKLKVYMEKRNDLKKKEEDARELVLKHEGTLYGIIGKMNERVYGSDTLTQIIAKVEAKTLPTVSEIKDKIILKSMFQSEDDMQKFVDGIIGEYTKKLQSKILQN